MKIISGALNQLLFFKSLGLLLKLDLKRDFFDSMNFRIDDKSAENDSESVDEHFESLFVIQNEGVSRAPQHRLNVFFLDAVVDVDPVQNFSTQLAKQSFNHRDIRLSLFSILLGFR